ncbi:hypothetical protein NW755_014092 [Fusarium falciforme]|uniref:Uncharacterized protein n=1 Tax=Fusarium falciforme TaxID=195108 RepID=A0A9W8QSP7_9HYPO|nr:hypothetical protein NW755_014092 [Fusarium falciforme]
MALLDEARQPVQLDMTAELGGMFFVAENIFSDHPTDQPGLTCYRRNLWQCLGDITSSSHPKYLLDEHGNELIIS